MEYELDYNLGTFVLVNWASKSETPLNINEAFEWSAKKKCHVTEKADREIGNILNDMELAFSGTTI